MKILILAASLVAGHFAMASDDIPTMHYQTWCDQNAVMGQTDRGEAVVKANCAASGKVCKETESPLRKSVIVRAYCDSKK